jgi:lysophospholipase L1-like esterase
MPIANPRTYLSDIIAILRTHWPQNRTVNIIVHGHSVPSGYFATPQVDTFNAYPHIFHYLLKQRFPYAVTNVIVTAIGGENSKSGAARFEKEVLCHRPDVILIDYGLNDRGFGLDVARAAWTTMIQQSLARKIRVILLTPTPDNTQQPSASEEQRQPLRQHAQQIRDLADQFGVGLVDSLAAFDHCITQGGKLEDLLSWPNHPNRQGHDLVAAALLRYFPADI